MIDLFSKLPNKNKNLTSMTLLKLFSCSTTHEISAVHKYKSTKYYSLFQALISKTGYLSHLKC